MLKPRYSVKDHMMIEMDPKILLTHQKGSWRNMFVTQPPVRKLKIECHIHRHWYEDEPLVVNATLRNEQGVRLNEIMDKIFPHLGILQPKTQYNLPAHMHLFDDAEVVEKDLYTTFVRSLSFQLYMSTKKGYIGSGSDWYREGWPNRACRDLTEEMRKELF